MNDISNNLGNFYTIFLVGRVFINLHVDIYKLLKLERGRYFNVFVVRLFPTQTLPESLHYKISLRAHRYQEAFVLYQELD